MCGIDARRSVFCDHGLMTEPTSPREDDAAGVDRVEALFADLAAEEQGRTAHERMGELGLDP